jgi:polar amino acid transport system permease protein
LNNYQDQKKTSKIGAFFNILNEHFYQKYKKIIVSILGIGLLAIAGVSIYNKMDYNWNWRLIPDLIVYYGEAPEDRGKRREVGKVKDFQNRTMKVEVLEDVAPARELYITVRTPMNAEKSFEIEPEQIKGNWKKGRSITIMDVEAPQTFTLVPGSTVFLKEVGWHTGPLLRGMLLTIFISAVSIIFAIILGTLMGLWRVSSSDILRFISKMYVEIVRGTPLLVQIYVFYFFVGKILDLSSIQAGIAALSFFAGAYVAEIIRAGIQSIPKGQMEASRAVGMNYFQAMRYIILPQAFRRILPPLAGQFISLIKDSSLVSVVGLSDITFNAQQSITISFATFEIWFAAAGIYLILTSTLSAVTHRLERRLLV